MEWNVCHYGQKYCWDLPYSSLIWQSFILAIGNLRSNFIAIKPPIINVHAYSNAHVHHITKLKTAKYFFMVLSQEASTEQPITVHLELYRFYRFIHFLFYIGQY